MALIDNDAILNEILDPDLVQWSFFNLFFLVKGPGLLFLLSSQPFSTRECGGVWSSLDSLWLRLLVEM